MPVAWVIFIEGGNHSHMSGTVLWLGSWTAEKGAEQHSFMLPASWNMNQCLRIYHPDIPTMRTVTVICEPEHILSPLSIFLRVFSNNNQKRN